MRGGETKGRKLLCKGDVGGKGEEKREEGEVSEMRRGNEMEGGSERRCCGG